MNQSRQYAAFYGALLASAVPALGDGEPAPIIPAWEIRADLSGDGLPAKLRAMLLPNAEKLGARPSLSIRGFDNPATADKDWLATLDIPGQAEQIWEQLHDVLKDDWGSPNESGQWWITDPESGQSFIIARDGESLQFSNATENLTLNLASTGIRMVEGRMIHGYVDLRAAGIAQESKLFQLARSATFSARTAGNGMVLHVNMKTIEGPAAERVEQAVREALDSKLLERLTPFLPKPALTRDSTDEGGSFTFTMDFDAAQTDRLIHRVIDHLLGEEADNPQPAPESDDADAKSR